MIIYKDNFEDGNCDECGDENTIHVETGLCEPCYTYAIEEGNY